MAKFIGVFFDGAGNPTHAVLTEDDNFGPHQTPGLAFVKVPVATATLIHDQHEFKKACIPALTATDKNIGAKAKADCDAIDAQRVVTKQTTDAALADSLAAWDALPQIVKDALEANSAHP